MKARKLKLIQSAGCEYYCTQLKGGIGNYGIEWEECQYGKDCCNGCTSPQFTRKEFGKVREKRKLDKFIIRKNRLWTGDVLK